MSPSRRPRSARRPAGIVATLVLALAAAVGGWWLRGAPTGPGSASEAPGPGVYALQGAVVQVIDGDTVVLRAGGRPRHIRLASIDAPETGGRDRQGQPFGQASRRHLDGQVGGRTLSARCYERDSYGRDVCDLLLDGGDTASRAQARAGMAWANRQGGGKYLRDPVVGELEGRARASRAGLWSQPAVAPWQWRQRCWNQGQC